MNAWRDLVTASLIGTERALVPEVSIPGVAPGEDGAGDPAAVLLDRAAMATAARRAGRRPDHAEPLAECERDPRPAVSPAAAGRLARMLSGQYPGLLAEWLMAVTARGLRLPPQFLPVLLDRARRSPADAGLRGLVTEAGGPRARWLAGLNPDWAFVTAPAQPGPEAWRLGDTGQRRSYLTGLLAADPGAARDLITAGWDAAPAADRTMFLSVLGGQLGPPDEPLLEAALADRSQDVRAWAAYLLARLPGSALGRRMAERALRCVRIEPGAGGGRLAVTPPAERDDSMRRDGIPPVPVATGAPRPDQSRLLLEIVTRTPLGAWTGAFGLDPAQLVALPAGDWAPLLYTGWARAAAAQQDRGWTDALIRHMITGGSGGTAAQLQAFRELARQASPALGAPGTLPEPGPDTPPVIRAVLTALRFRWDMLEELGQLEELGHDDNGD
jgi:Family of unknown function (DUF5691)